ncbi:MAG: hypothetical protein NZ908_01360 [Candidatus Micrarchaeota archaeon]|nr:hypothetical protein [Candidatus Micrarchaeota archaeon]
MIKSLYRILLFILYHLILKFYVYEFMHKNKLRSIRSELDIRDSIFSDTGDGGLVLRYPKYHSGFPELILFPDRNTRENYQVVDFIFLPIIALKDSKPIGDLNIPYYISIFLLASQVLLFPIFFKDDLLRHLRAWDGEFKSYDEFYLMEWTFSFPIYPIWDIMYSISYQYLGYYWAVKLWEFISFLIFIYAFHVSTKHLPTHLRILVLSIIIFLNARFLLARPSNMIGFLVVLLSVIESSIFRFILGLFIGISYYLFFIFLIPFLNIREVRYAFFLSLIFWFVWSDFKYIQEIYTFLSYVVESRKQITILENISFWTSVLNNVLVGMIFIFWIFNSQKNIDFIRTLYFTLLNQVRFLDTILLLMAKTLREDINIPRIYGLIGFIYMMYAMNHLEFSYINDPDFVKKVSLKDVEILSYNMDIQFMLVLFGDNIRASPSMEIGLTDREILALIINNTLDCDVIRRKGIDLVIERSLKETYPCLELYDIYREIRFWRVR